MEDNLPLEGDLNAGVRKRRPENWRDVRVESYVDNIRRQMVGVKVFLDFRDTDWVSVDHEGQIDSSVIVRADWEFSLKDLQDFDDSEQLLDFMCELLYKQIQYDLDDLLLAPVVQKSDDPLWHVTDMRKFLPRDFVRKAMENAPKFFAPRVAEGSPFRDEDWFRQWELDEKKEINDLTRGL